MELLKKWLVNYKFRNWKKTGSSGKIVTAAMREKRATEIARKLNDVKRWKSHSRTLSRSVIESEMKLMIDDFGADKELNRRIRSYSRLLQDYMMRVGHSIVVHVPQTYKGM